MAGEPRCPQCGGSRTRLSDRSDDIVVCRDCGEVSLPLDSLLQMLSEADLPPEQPLDDEPV